MAAVILWTAFGLVSGSTRVLLDESLPPSELEVVQGVIENEEAIRGFHKLRARKSGPRRHIDFHLQLEAETTLGEARKIAEGLEEDPAQPAELRHPDTPGRRPRPRRRGDHGKPRGS